MATNLSILDLYYDPMSLILADASTENSSELLKNRLVNTTWKGYTDYMIQLFWTGLYHATPKGVVNIREMMEAIDATNANAPTPFKFVELMKGLKLQGCPIPDSPRLFFSLGEFRQLQCEYDTALKTIWPELRKIVQLANIPDLPAPDAEVNIIRPFLKDHGQALETVRVLILNGLQLNLIPPELKLFKNLKILHLRENKLTNIYPLIASFPKLTELDVSDNLLTDISPLSGLKNINALNLTKNKLTDVSPLATLDNLMLLGLHHNRLKDVSPLSNLARLNVLALANNELEDVTPLAKLVRLQSVILSNNQIKDASEIKKHLRGTRIVLQGNPCEIQSVKNSNGNGKRSYDQAFGNQ